MSQKTWRLTHIIGRYQINGLSSEEVVGFLAALPREDRADWYVWNVGWPEWVKSTECAEVEVTDQASPWWFGSKLASFRSFVPPPPPPVMKEGLSARSSALKTQLTPTPSLRLVKEEDRASEPMEEPVRFTQRRRYPRVKLRLQVVVTLEGKKTFRSHSVNVSKGGLQLEKKVPESFREKYCQVYLSNSTSSENIGFKARILSNVSDPFRLAFEDCDSRYQEILQGWIDAALASESSAA